MKAVRLLAVRLGTVQILQDLALCRCKFPGLICRPIRIHYFDDEDGDGMDGLIAMWELDQAADWIRIIDQKHYRLISHAE